MVMLHIKLKGMEHRALQHPLVSTRRLVSTSTLTVATVSVYRVMFTLSGDNVHYQPLLSTFKAAYSVTMNIFRKKIFSF